MHGLGRACCRTVVCVRRRMIIVSMASRRLLRHQHLDNGCAVVSGRAQHGSGHRTPQREERAQQNQQPVAELFHRLTIAENLL